jgi:tight adherence protein B
MKMQVLALAFLATAAIGGLAWVFLYPLLSGEKKAEGRRASIAKSEPVAARQTQRDQKTRREQVEGSLKEVEARRAKDAKVTLTTRLTQAGLDWEPRKFMIVSGILALAAFAAAMLGGGGPLGAVGLAFAAGFGLPRWMLSAIIETQAIGMPLGEACGRLFERMPVPEANFFGIVIAIQQKSGGNLSEALGNLSKVLRDRKKMAEKIQAMSMEAKASAGIIGALPPIVMILVYITTPDYISLLWTHPTGQLMLVGCVVWMTMGILVMKKMINFDF